MIQEIPRVNNFEIMHPIGKQEQCGEWEDDFVLDDNHRLQETIEYMYNCNVEKIYPCHCVSLLAKAKMMEKLPVVEVGVGMTVSI